MSLLTLGQFVFETNTLTFNKLQRTRNWDYADNRVAAGRKKRQFIGVGEETITLPFLIYQEHGVGNRQSLDDLADMADAGLGYTMCDGSGYLYGVFTIDSIDESREDLMFGGIARKIDGTIRLTRVDDDKIQRQSTATTASTASTAGFV